MSCRAALRMNDVPFSGIRKIFEQANQLEKEGSNVIHLEIGRPDFDTPLHIKEAAKRALDEGRVHYTPNLGMPELREAIADKLKRDNNVRYDPDTEILVTVGASEAVLIAMLALLDPGDEVLIPDPSWLNYVSAARLAGAKPILIPLVERNDYQIDVNKAKELITPRSKMLVVVSPHNPTGSVQHPETLREIAILAERHDLIVLSDEIYEKIIYDGHKHLSIASLPGMKERAILVNGFSKAYSMTGWRIGYVAGPRELIAILNRLHQYNTTCATSFAQAGAIAALKGPQVCVEEMVGEFDRRRRLVVGSLNQIERLSCGQPRGAFYAFVNIRGLGMNSEEFCSYLLRRAGVATVPGSVFGPNGEGHFRLSYASSYESLSEAMKRIRIAIEDLP